ncbi:MAG TPA: glycoside hydrolase family 3 N-terminal domain-containing protein [Polyangiaceae bacterium]|nr:glycoside hydrolase family 3 N-terminal domain-containing protein [Polyangiaceae bacterium]
MSRHFPLAFLSAFVLASCLTPGSRQMSSAPAAPQALAKPLLARDAGTPLFIDPDRPLDVRVQDLIARLTLPEKAALLIDKASAIERLGIPKYDAWNEALHGVAWRDGVTVFPQAIGLASTWDAELLHDVATAISTEARALYNQGTFGLTLWSPVINIARDPRWGRTQEGYGEDPYLASRMAVAFVKGIQGDHPFYFRAVATPKHFALNNVEATRTTGSSDAPEQVIRDYYLPQFRAAVVEGGAESIMCSYNRVNGVPACGNPWLLDTVLRKEWGFGGFVVSDCGAITAMVWGHHVKPSDEVAVATGLRAGCDLECGTAYGDQIGRAVADGAISEADVDRALARVLTARFRLGMFDPPERNPYSSIPMSVVDGPEHRKLALAAARESLVLLKNDGILPLDTSKTKKLAVIGPAAGMFEHGSAGYHGSNGHLVTPREGIERRAGSAAAVSFVAGTLLAGSPVATSQLVPETWLRTSDGQAGLRGQYFANRDLSGEPALTRTDRDVDFAWADGSPAPGLPQDGFSVRWTGKLVPTASGRYVLTVTSDDGSRLSLDGKRVLEDWTIHGAMPRHAVVTLQAGHAYDLVLEYFEAGGGAEAHLSYALVADETAAAVRAAREADAVVFVAGVDSAAADEERDFSSLALPADQSELLDAVLRANSRTVVVLQTGNPLVLTAAQKRAPAIIQAWYPGQDTGTALAEVLFGDTNPSGKLPITFYGSLADLPPMDDYDVRKGRTYMYLAREPAFPFGHGLSYTKFQYGPLLLSGTTVQADGVLRVEFELANVGARAGAEVAQVYVHPPRGPKKALRAFRRVALERGATTHVAIDFSIHDLAHYDPDAKRDVVDPGRYELAVGGSSADVRQRATFDVAP